MFWGFLPWYLVIRESPLTMRLFLISTTTPYNPHGNSQCKHFNSTLFGLMRSLDHEQKPNWHIYLPSLVFSYNATPHSTTWFQPYEFMFGCKAPMPCDNWLGLRNYEVDGQQLDTLVSTNKWALKLFIRLHKVIKPVSAGKSYWSLWKIMFLNLNFKLKLYSIYIVL